MGVAYFTFPCVLVMNLIFIYLLHLYPAFFSSKEPKAVLIILLLSMLSSQQQPCEVGWASQDGEDQDVPASSTEVKDEEPVRKKEMTIKH